MSVQYISHEKLEVIRKFLESKDLSDLKIELPWILWRAKDLYSTEEENPKFYLTDSRYACDDLSVQFDEEDKIKCIIIFNDYTGENWIFKA